ncbi:MAG: MaoC/PaaZ C-terminal domain-containing protein [Propionicimonas sp.]
MDRPIELLPELPRMGAAFARALLPSRAHRAELPRHTVMVNGHRQDLNRLAEYARVCGFTLRDTVPPTWLHVLTFALQVALLGSHESTIRLVGVVHVSNMMRLARPVAAGERLQLLVHAENLRPHRRGALVDLVSQVRVADEVVWDGVSSYLAKGMNAPGEPATTPKPDFESTTPITPTALWRLPADLGRQYRRVSGDPNPIHTHRLAAAAFGFERPIIHGMWTHARLLAALENRLPGAYQVSARFTRPILLPGTVGFAARRTGDGWESAVTTPDGGKPYLVATIGT